MWEINKPTTEAMAQARARSKERESRTISVTVVVHEPIESASFPGKSDPIYTEAVRQWSEFYKDVKRFIKSETTLRILDTHNSSDHFGRMDESMLIRFTVDDETVPFDSVRDYLFELIIPGNLLPPDYEESNFGFKLLMDLDTDIASETYDEMTADRLSFFIAYPPGSDVCVNLYDDALYEVKRLIRETTASSKANDTVTCAVSAAKIKTVYIPAVDDPPKEDDIFDLLIIASNSDSERGGKLNNLRNSIYEHIRSKANLVMGAAYPRTNPDRNMRYYHPFNVIAPDGAAYPDPEKRQFKVRITYRLAEDGEAAKTDFRQAEIDAKTFIDAKINEVNERYNIAPETMSDV